LSQSYEINSDNPHVVKKIIKSYNGAQIELSKKFLNELTLVGSFIEII